MTGETSTATQRNIFYHLRIKHRIGFNTQYLRSINNHSNWRPRAVMKLKALIGLKWFHSHSHNDFSLTHMVLLIYPSLQRQTVSMIVLPVPHVWLGNIIVWIPYKFPCHMRNPWDPMCNMLRCSPHVTMGYYMWSHTHTKDYVTEPQKHRSLYMLYRLWYRYMVVSCNIQHFRNILHNGIPKWHKMWRLSYLNGFWVFRRDDLCLLPVYICSIDPCAFAFLKAQQTHLCADRKSFSRK